VSPIHVTIRYVEDCPHWRPALERLRAAVHDAGLGEASITTEAVATLDEVERLRFRGSPTILINGTDPFAGPGTSVGLSCRIYRTESGTDGAPNVVQLIGALKSAGSSVPSPVDAASDASFPASDAPEAGARGL